MPRSTWCFCICDLKNKILTQLCQKGGWVFWVCGLNRTDSSPLMTPPPSPLVPCITSPSGWELNQVVSWWIRLCVAHQKTILPLWCLCFFMRFFDTWTSLLSEELGADRSASVWRLLFWAFAPNDASVVSSLLWMLIPLPPHWLLPPQAHPGQSAWRALQESAAILFT